MNKAVIIVAGGKGMRMGSDVPKQFLVLDGKPILMHTIERFRSYDPDIQIIVVLPKDQMDYWHGLCLYHKFSVAVDIVEGGAERFHSVRNGLMRVNPEVRLVAVHDGVRPFVSNATISACFDEAEKSGAAIPVTDVFETLRRVPADGPSRTVPRSEYKLVQTPQVFRCDLLDYAYRQPYSPRFTDDASVVEAVGHAIALVPGNRENIKITTPSDLRTAVGR